MDYNVGDNIRATDASWTFGGEVPRTFDSHVGRSVPLYQEGHNLINALSDYFVADNSVVYDLGASTGSLLSKLAERHKSKPNLRLIGVDREEAMVQEARARTADEPRIEMQCQELVDLEMETTDLVISYYTIQFVRPAFRQEILNRIYQSMNWGGALLMFEKTRGPDARFQDMITGLYNDFKLERGFNPEEIIGKSKSLKGVLEPFSTQGNMDMLARAGFKDVMVIMKYICFEGFIAIK
ncbi:MAG: methyltransferase domain-containing protein [Leptospiraceae bacterium]|nr:methyltransferase domain-containing protein [Leptospiraceae bacterium]MCB1304806.1 methyltransferase domain-containing protein [Leptospiraceae bacterium]